MTQKSKINLHQSCILDFPFHIYPKDFTFYVNGKSYQTCQIAADLLSPKIRKLHINDPTFKEFCIKTKNSGNFSKFLDLIDFESKDIDNDEVPFFIELIDILECDFLQLENDDIKSKITIDNVISRIQDHKKYKTAYSDTLQKEIEFLSQHFYLMDEKSSSLLDLPLDILERVISDPKLQIKSEDQLVSNILDLCSYDSDYMILFKYVSFSKVSSSKNSELLEKVSFSDLLQYVPDDFNKIISKQLKSKKNDKNEEEEEECNDEDDDTRYRYYPRGIYIDYDNDKEFKGIINELKNYGNIYNYVNFTSSTLTNFIDDVTKDHYVLIPQNTVVFDNTDIYFATKGDWICIEFLEDKIIPKKYTLKSGPEAERSPKSWILEGSNDNENWETLDVKEDCDLIRGENKVYTFSIENPNNESFHFIRITQMMNWSNEKVFMLDSIEFYGYLLLNED